MEKMPLLICLVWICTLVLSSNAEKDYDRQVMKLLEEQNKKMERLTSEMSAMKEKSELDTKEIKKLKETRIKELKENEKLEKLTSEISAMKEKSEFEIKKLTGRIKELEENDKLGKSEMSAMKEKSELDNKEFKKLEAKIAKLEETCDHLEPSLNRDAGSAIFRAVRSDDGLAWQPVVSQMASQVSSVEAQLQALQNSVHQQVQTLSTGTSYVRWGKSACPGSAELVYTGDVGGSWFNYAGAAVDYLCLPQNPVFDNLPIPGLLPHNSHQQLFGAEYESRDSTTDLEPVCAVCRTNRSSTVMVPATNVCPAGWTVEYTGYMMSGDNNHPAATQFICVDKSQDYQLGTNHDDNGKLLYYTVTRCGSLACPPYINDKIVQCVVCSK